LNEGKFAIVNPNMWIWVKLNLADQLFEAELRV
jgi:hypothetical protein